MKFAGKLVRMGDRAAFYISAATSFLGEKRPSGIGRMLIWCDSISLYYARKEEGNGSSRRGFGVGKRDTPTVAT